MHTVPIMSYALTLLIYNVYYIILVNNGALKKSPLACTQYIRLLNYYTTQKTRRIVRLMRRRKNESSLTYEDEVE